MTAPHVHHVRVYYEDTDFSGAVYHANYLRFMERARTEMLRGLGVDQGAALTGGADERFGFVVRAMTIDFHRPARMDDWLAVATTVEKIGAATLELLQVVKRGGDTLASARVRVACVVDGRAARMPPGVRAKLEKGAA
jgi:acyl-CoA thioester hydrolase